MIKINFYLDTNKDSAAMYCACSTLGEEVEKKFIVKKAECMPFNLVESIPDTAKAVPDIGSMFFYERIAVLKSGKLVVVRYAKEWLHNGLFNELGVTHWYHAKQIQRCIAICSDPVQMEMYLGIEHDTPAKN